LVVDGDVNFGSGNKFISTANILQSAASDGARLRAAVSSAANPTFATTGDTNTGVFFDAVDNAGISTAGLQRIRTASNGDISFYEDTGTTPKFFWDASAESLGIGTSSPAAPLHISIGDSLATPISTADDLIIEGNSSIGMSFLTSTASSSNQKIAFGDAADADIGQIEYQHSNNSMNFKTNAAERMRIDSSGNVLVGTTSVQGAGGVTLSGAGYVYSSRPSSTAIYADRTGSDGAIQEFRKDGSTVGSIGSYSGDNLTIGTGAAGIRFDVGLASIIPQNITTNANNDAATDLGHSAVRFQDLYLSGGVYLGGTGSANKLDDYEEGTWTPSFGASASATIHNTTYTKIGRLVHITAYFSGPTNFPTSSTLSIMGLPFTGNANYQMAQVWYNSANDVNALVYLAGNSSTLTLRPRNGTPADLTELSVQMTYITNQ